MQYLSIFIKSIVKVYSKLNEWDIRLIHFFDVAVNNLLLGKFQRIISLMSGSAIASQVGEKFNESFRLNRLNSNHK